ncbi:MAG: MipA/OmpV family protein [Bacillota bacterium]
MTASSGRAALAAALALAAGIAPPAWADGAPTPVRSSLDLGVGLGAVSFPAYPGSEEVRKLLIPFPYIVYHSTYLDVNRDQVRGKVLKDEHWSLDVDFGGQVQVKSADVQERQGMPDRDWLGEVGPALRYFIWNGEEPGTHLDAVLPVRAAVSAQGLTITRRGWVTGPRLEGHEELQGPGDRVDLDATLTADYVDRQFANYYYGVAPQFATTTRPAYDAPGGYAGWNLNLGFSWHHGDLVYGGFVAYTSLHGAAFQASPLVARANGLSMGFAVSWVIQRIRE